MSSTQLADVREELADLDAALAVLLELERRRERRAGAPLGLQRDRQRLAGVLRERRLGVERVDVRRAAVHEQVDDALRLGGKRRLLRRERIDAAIGAACSSRSPSSAQRDAPMPMPQRDSSSRRVTNRSAMLHALSSSIDEHELVGLQQHLRVPLPDDQRLRPADRRSRSSRSRSARPT